MLLRSVLSVHLTSSKSLVGVAGVVSEIQKEKKVNGQLMASVVISFFASFGSSKSCFRMLRLHNASK